VHFLAIVEMLLDDFSRSRSPVYGEVSPKVVDEP